MSFFNTKMLKITLLIISIGLGLFVFNNCAMQSNAERVALSSSQKNNTSATNSESSTTSDTTSGVSQPAVKCVLNGTSYEVGQSISGYAAMSAVYPSGCGQPVVRTCLASGQFDGSVPVYQNCSQSCLNPNTNAVMVQGESLSFYSVSQATSAAECEKARVVSVCQSGTGVLSPNPTSYQNRYASCAIVTPPTTPTDPVTPTPVLNCTYPTAAGYVVPKSTNVNSTVVGYSAQTATYPLTCTGLNVTRTCVATSTTMAQWNGSVPLYAACTQKCLHPDSSTPVDQNTSLIYYTKSSGTQAECDAAKIVSTCSSSGLFLPAIPATKYSSCAVSVPSTPPPTTSNGDLLGIGPCVPGKGKDYQVGSGAGQLASLDLVPWESLVAGDTVRIFYSANPYKGKFILSGQGTADAPIRVCGVKSSSGQRPIIDGNGATSRSTAGMGSSAAQQKALVFIKTGANKTKPPSYVQIDGLVLKSAHPSYTFKDQSGATLNYVAFGACVWFENGSNVTIADNEITDCNQGIFSVSVDGNSDTITKNLRIAGNIFSNNGIANDALKHVNYIQTVGVIYEYNIYKALRSGATGNSIKDRSVGPIIRYNRIEAGTRAIDLVDAEEHKETAKADPKYRETFVYGNQFIKSSRELIHYGGDHSGSEAYFRKGTLYFFNNSVQASGSVKIFQITTTDEKVEAFNNVIYYSSGTPTLRTDDETSSGTLPTGGKLNLGKNWISTGWKDSDSTLSSAVTGVTNLITGSTAPFDTNFVPITGSAIINAATTNISGAAMYPVSNQLSTLLQPEVRPTTTAADLGAVERP